MMRALLLAIGLLLLGATAALAEDGSDRDCAAVIADLGAARAAGDAGAFPALWQEAQAPDSGCEERAIFCIGQSLALGQLDAVYAAADAGSGQDDLIALAETGLAWGRPWQLEATLGDMLLEAGREGGGGAVYSRSALHFQQAMITLAEPPGCADFGEPARPPAEAIAGLYQSLSTALLLAEPLEVATTRCAPCQWLFLNSIGDFSPSVRPLPITFADGSDVPTPAGAEAIAALLECLKAGAQDRIALSGHTDPRGTEAYNLRLSERRLETVAEALAAGGYEGEIVLEPMGESAPFPAGDGYNIADRLRLDRRVELREISEMARPQCG